jgi:hypothetical protein
LNIQDIEKLLASPLIRRDGDGWREGRMPNSKLAMVWQPLAGGHLDLKTGDATLIMSRVIPLDLVLLILMMSGLL